MNLNYFLEDENLFKKPLRYISTNGLTYIRRGPYTEPELKVYSQEYELLRTIKLVGVLAKLQELDINPVFKAPSLVGIFSRNDDEILLNFNSSIIAKIDKNGQFLNAKIIPTVKDSGYVNSNVWCSFEQFRNGHLAMIANYGNQNLIGLSKNINPLFTEDEPFDFKYLNDVFTFPENFNKQITCTQVQEKTQTIGSELRQINENYQHQENTPFIHYVTRYKICSAIDIGKERILLLVMTTGSNVRSDPNKNMPYFLFTLDTNTGEIIDRYAPEDRSLYKKNFKTRLFSIDSNVANLKTHDAIYSINEHLELKKTACLKNRKYSLFRAYRVIGHAGSRVHFANDETGVIINFNFGPNMEQCVEQLVKEYKTFNKK